MGEFAKLNFFFVPTFLDLRCACGRDMADRWFVEPPLKSRQKRGLARKLGSVFQFALRACPTITIFQAGHFGTFWDVHHQSQLRAQLRRCDATVNFGEFRWTEAPPKGEIDARQIKRVHRRCSPTSPGRAARQQSQWRNYFRASVMAA